MRGNRSELKLGYSPANAVGAMLTIHPHETGNIIRQAGENA